MSLVDDVRYAATALARKPGLCAIAILTLAAGIAASTAMFGIVYQLLLQPPAHVREPQSLRRIYYDFHRGDWGPTPTTTFPVIAALQRDVPTLEIAGYTYPSRHTLGAGPDARRINVQLVTGGFFPMLGVRAAAGRFFGPDEDRIPDGTPVMVLSDGFWRSELGSDTTVIGRSLSVNGRALTVIGIAPAGFTGLDRERVDAWVPISVLAAQQSGDEWHSEPRAWWVKAVARLRPGTGPEVATQATVAVRNEMRRWKDYPGDRTATVLLGSIIGTRTPGGIMPESKVSLWLLGVSIVVLLIACANVANLLLVHAVQRRREIAVRLALGVSRARLARLFFVEAGLLAAAGGAAGLLLAMAGTGFVRRVLLPEVVWTGASVDGTVLAFTIAAAAVCVLLAGVAPALHGLGMPLSEGLKEAASQSTGHRGRSRHALLALQTGLSVVLLIGAGLFVRSLHNVVSRDVGVDFDHAALVTMDLERAGFARTRIEEIFRAADERLSALPGVASVALIRAGVPTMRAYAMSIKVPGLAEWPDLELGGPYYSEVPSDYFSTIGTSIARGRAFTAAEDHAPSRVMIVNQITAKAFWPGQDALGKCGMLGRDSVCTEVVGIIANDMLFRVVQDERALLYVPPGHPAFGKGGPSALVFRTHGDPKSIIGTARRELQALAANMPFVSVETFAERVERQFRPWRLGATMLTLFGIIALVIAAAGLYSVMSYAVSQRRREIGVRMALGARARDVVRLITWQSSRAIALGIAVGVLAAVLASRWVTPMLYETSPRDPAMYLVAVLVLGVAAVLASVAPARRGTRVHPAVAMRAE